MTITLVKGTGSSAVTTTLVAGQSRNSTGSPIGPEDLRGSDAPGVVTHDYIGAEREHPELIRCNHGTISFGVTRTFADVATAAAYMSKGAATAPGSGADGFWGEGSEGALYFGSTKVFEHACVTSRTYAWVGNTVKVNYTIEG